MVVTPAGVWIGDKADEKTIDSKLAVDGNVKVIGGVKAKEVKVTLTGFPDYVFEQDYQLKPLSEVEQYVKQNKHLPEVPSAAQVEKEGLNLGEMDKVLLKKVEELTLYLIELKKENEQLKKQNEQQDEKLKALLDQLSNTDSKIRSTNK